MNSAGGKQTRGPRPLNRLEVLYGLKMSTWEGSFATLWGTLTTGAFLTGYALWLGANDLAIGLVTAIPTFAGLIQLLSSYFGERLSERKRFVAWASLLARSCWLPILLLPMMMPRAIALYPFLLLYSLCYLLIQMPLPAYMSWMSDLVPPDHRGRYFGRRNMIMGLVGMLISLPAAWFLDYMIKGRHQEALGFGTLFGIAVVAGFASFYFIMRQPEPPKREIVREKEPGLSGVLAYYRSPFADPNFRRLLLFNTVFVVGQNFAAPFFSVYALKFLQLDYSLYQVFIALQSAATLAFMPLIGYLTDKFGNKPLLVICVWGVFTLPFNWIPCTSHTLVLTIMLVGVFGGILGGIFWGGVGLAQFNLLIRLSPPERTPVYVATMSAITGIAGGLAPMVGSVVMQTLDHWHVTLFHVVIINYHITFIIAAVIRLLSLFWLRGVVDTSAASAGDVLRELGRANPRSWRNIRKLQKGDDVDTRLRATEALSEQPTTLATAELKVALADPSHAVRQQAAIALGEIGDASSVEALLDSLGDPAAGVLAQAARALGQIGDRRAVEPLIRLLRDLDAPIGFTERIAVVQALGSLRGPDVEVALLNTLNELDGTLPEVAEELEEALVIALGRAGGPVTVGTLTAQLEDPTISVRLRLALVRTLGSMGSLEALPVLRQTLERAGRDALLVPALADSLARLNDSGVLPKLIELLPWLDSVVARKQTANAIGSLAGISPLLYGLLSSDEMERDTSVARILQGIEKRLRPKPAGLLVKEVEEHYVSGDYRLCLTLIGQILSELNGSTLSEENEYASLALEKLTSMQDSPIGIEHLLTAIAALRRLTDS